MVDKSLAEDAVRQMAAGIALIQGSSLLFLNAPSRKFGLVDMTSFEQAAADVHPRFGRVMKWIWFSTGAEYLLKGALISTGDLVPLSGPEKLDFPSENEIASWTARAFTSAAKTTRTDYKTMSGMQNGLKQLCGRHGSERERGKSLRAAFLLLGESVRNRDAHAYVPDVRVAHFHLLPLFAEAFNTLLSWSNSELVTTALEKA
jgi:hypothetical protein